MPRGLRYALLAVGAVPWLLLLIGQGLCLIVLVAAVDELGKCFDTGALPTLATFWLALVPIPLAIVTLLGRRTVGLALLGVGFPLFVLSVGNIGCPGSVLPWDDSDDGSVPVFGWMLAAYLAVLVCWGLVLLLS